MRTALSQTNNHQLEFALRSSWLKSGVLSTKYVCSREWAIVADCGWSFFRHGVEVVGYSGVYAAGNFNHPSGFGYDVGYGKPLDEIARYLADMAFKTRVFGRS